MPMSDVELRLSWMLWLCVGFLFGYRYHVLKVRDEQAEKELNQVFARVAGVSLKAQTEVPVNARVN